MGGDRVTQKNNIRKKTESPGGRYTLNNPNVNMAGAGVLRVPGKVRDIGQYGDRLREGRKYPNRRRRIIRGKDLTTPLARKKAIEKARQKKAKAAAATAKEDVKIEIKIAKAGTGKLPVNILFCLLIVSVFFFGLVVSQIVLNEQNYEINDWNDKVDKETKKEKNLKNEFENKNDLEFIINYAVNELDMVKEESTLIQKKYISGRSGDKAEVVESSGNPFVGLPDIMSAIFKK